MLFRKLRVDLLGDAPIRGMPLPGGPQADEVVE